MINLPTSAEKQNRVSKLTPLISLTLLSVLSGCQSARDPQERSTLQPVTQTADLHREIGESLERVIADINSSSQMESEGKPPVLDSELTTPAPLTLDASAVRLSGIELSEFMPTFLIQAQAAPHENPFQVAPPSEKTQDPEDQKNQKTVAPKVLPKAKKTLRKTHQEQHVEIVKNQAGFSTICLGYLILVIPTILLLILRGEIVQRRREEALRDSE